MRNISSWAIRHPIIPIVLFVALTLLGIIAFMRMDVNNNPDIDFPAAQISVSQPGAAPPEVETQITQKIEAAVRGINGVDEITSFVGEGDSETTVQFTVGTPVDRAVNDVRNAIAQVRSDLPEGILEPQVTRIDIAGGPLAYFSVEGVDMTLPDLSWFVDDTVAKRLLSVEGMAQVHRGGGVDREIRVILDPAKMQALGVTASQINQVLRASNVNAAGGRTEIAGSEQGVRVLGNARNAYDLGNTQIALGGGRTIKLSDVATVRDAYGEQRSYGMMNGRQVLSFSIAKAKGYSDVTVYDKAVKEIDKIRKDYPNIKITQLFTTTDYVRDQYESAMEAMIIGAVLAVVVVLLFLRDVRATIISALAIPLSAVPTFWFMSLLGFSLNGLSLLALSLVAGVLVDDAIVEIENIVRHMRMGKTAYQASIDAADEIGQAVVATTFTIVAVFLPVGLMPGITGQFFKNFGITVVAAVLTSLAVARLITPMVAAYFLKAKGHAPHASGKLMDKYLGLLRWSIRNRWKTMGIGVVALILTFVTFAMLPSTFQPTVNVDYSQVQIELPPGSTLDQSAQMANRVATMLQRTPEVKTAFSDVNVGNANIFLTLKKDRKMTSVEFERHYAPLLRSIPDARINFQSQNGGGAGRDLNVTLVGDNPDTLNQAALNIIAGMRTIPEVREPRLNGDLRRPEITIKPRLDLAAQLGVSTASLSQAIRIATLGEINQNTAKFSLSDRQIPIRVALSENARENLGAIENLPVPTATGASVPLKLVADISFGAGPTQLRRFQQRRRVSIGADLAPGQLSGPAMTKIMALPAMKNLPHGVEQIPFGDAKWQAELFGNFIFAVVSGIFLVFAVLVLLYKRVLPPFVNMGSLLLAPLGSAIALLITGNALSMPVMIGLLMLLGIVGKNSILLIDFAIEEMGKGVPKDQAIVDAGHKRAQPIVMTTVAMVAGMLPIALSFTGDGSWRAPMGITVIGGLILSTVLTLVIVPAGFHLADSVEKWLAPLFGRLLTYRPGDNVPTAQAAE
ncbi:MAG TPA: efflux RND transporter permease subunit [Allosphingosinicella sp.]|jgi:multidrug efflux pump subunit AcrB|nr:efflux RND transporter permease subunit [Allosphingosinicella sp.]